MARTKFSNVDFDLDSFELSPVCSVVAAMAATAVVGGAISADASRSAANKQSDAANAASAATLDATDKTNAMQQGMFNQTQQNNAPFLGAGQGALAALYSGMGLGTLQNPAAVAGGANTGNNGATGTGAAAQGANGTFTNAQGQLVDANNNPVSAPAQGVTNYGLTNDQLAAAGASQAPGSLTGSALTPQNYQMDPSYQFNLDQGEKQLQASAAARGGLLSGQGGVDINNYAQQSANNGYAAAYARNQSTQQNTIANLMGIAGIGSSTAANQASTAASTANSMANTTMSGTNSSNNYLTSGAASQAAGTVGQANAWTGAAQNGMSNWMTMQYLNGKNGISTPVGTSGGGQVGSMMSSGSTLGSDLGGW